MFRPASSELGLSTDNTRELASRYDMLTTKDYFKRNTVLNYLEIVKKEPKKGWYNLFAWLLPKPSIHNLAFHIFGLTHFSAF